MSDCLLSLCIPTNGVSEWVFPVLDSIYSQGVDDSLFEVIVEDNGKNSQFKTAMGEYVSQHRNLVYKETTAYEFLSEIECYKNATGLFIKFINHRTKLCSGSLQYFIDFVQKYKEQKPCVYFGNGVIPNIKHINEYNSFNDYVAALSFWSSWSTGMGFWKDDFDKISTDEKPNLLFPHALILFHERNKKLYIIDNSTLLNEIPVGSIPKGRYNLFNAFAVEYVLLILGLMIEHDITYETFFKIKNDNFYFLETLYFDYVFLKKPCSYDLKNVAESLNVFYSLSKIKRRLPKIFVVKTFAKLKYILSNLRSK